jgi:hypothetical protein
MALGFHVPVLSQVQVTASVCLQLVCTRILKKAELSDRKEKMVEDVG